MNLNTKFYKIKQSDIDKVPCAKIFDNKLNVEIQKSCKRVLYKAMIRKDYKNDEMAEIIDINGKIVGTMYGYNGKIDTSNEEYYEALLNKPELSLIIIHNHPNNSRLSFGDIHSFLFDREILGVIAVSNNGNVYYCYKTCNEHNFYRNLGYSMINLRLKNKHIKNIESILENKLIQNSTKYKLKFGKSNRRK